jgi:hypothetical protein
VVARAIGSSSSTSMLVVMLLRCRCVRVLLLRVRVARASRALSCARLLCLPRCLRCLQGLHLRERQAHGA